MGAVAAGISVAPPNMGCSWSWRRPAISQVTVAVVIGGDAVLDLELHPVRLFLRHLALSPCAPFDFAAGHDVGRISDAATGW